MQRLARGRTRSCGKATSSQDVRMQGERDRQPGYHKTGVNDHKPGSVHQFAGDERACQCARTHHQ